MTEFVRHLHDYLPLFRQLSKFNFIYLARTDTHFQAAREMFDSLVTIPLRSDSSDDLMRYFEVRSAWDQKQYSALSEADLIFRNAAKARFTGERFENRSH
jgi:hypothetical protein